MSNAYPEFLKKWNFSQPEDTRALFSQILTNQELSESEALQLQTQIARTYSLQAKFKESHVELDQVKPKLGKYAEVDIRYYLERGRSFNSNNEKAKAIEQFKQALEISRLNKIDGLTIDTLHMLAIAESNADKSLQLNLQALEIAENSSDSNAIAWRGSIYNNLGWTYHGMKEYQKALDLFNKGVDFRAENKQEKQLFIARWAVARTYRSLDKINEALKIQLELFEESKKSGQNDGYNYEELGELYLILKKSTESKKFFKLAADQLSKDNWFVKNEAKRLARIRDLAQ